jgi:DNA anti-recombination protein RmuC
VTAELIITLANLLVLALGALVAWRRVKPEATQLRADALESTSEAASKSAEMFTKALQDIEKLQARQTALSMEIDDLKKALKRSNAERNAAFNWAARLIKQMQEIDPHVVPEPYQPPPDTDMNITPAKPEQRKDGA